MGKVRIVAIGLVLLLADAPGVAAAGLPAWDIVPSANVGSAPSELLGVSSPVAGQVWAVGSGGVKSLIEKWNGSSFVTVRSPSVRGRDTVLEDVFARTTADAWAVGHADRTDFVGSQTFIVRWNGSTWARVPSPNRGTADDSNILTGVASITATDAWAVGTFSNFASGGQALTLRWNGSQWTDVPNTCGFGLQDVFALSSTNVWAVGGNNTCRWNGSTWTRFAPAPPPNQQSSLILQDVSGSGPSDLWAVGFVASSCGEGQVCFSGAAERWNGTRWTFVPVDGLLYGVHALAANDVWAVGQAIGSTVLHYNGSIWETVPTPYAPGTLFAVDAATTNDLWAAGSRFENGMPRTLAEHAPAQGAGSVEGSTTVGNATVSWFGPESGSVASDPFGHYEVGGLTAGRYTFTASYPGCTPVQRQADVVAGQTITVNLPITC
ncbi:MAG: carboxypeptidase-like regulatory domain-containing protein [Actinomycetota bacterium]